MKIKRSMMIGVILPIAVAVVGAASLVAWSLQHKAGPAEGSGLSSQELDKRATWAKNGHSVGEEGEWYNTYSFDPKGIHGPVLLLFATARKSGDQWKIELLKSEEVQPGQLQDFLSRSGTVYERVWMNEGREEGFKFGTKFSLSFLGADLERDFKKMNISYVIGLPGIAREQLMESILAKTESKRHYTDSSTMLFEVRDSPEQICIAALW